MSIRVSILFLLVTALSAWAWKDWFKALCGLIVLMAVLEHPDMPREIMGVQGLNPWNVLMASILLAWAVNRRGSRRRWDMPSHITVMLLLYLLVIVVGFVRAVLDFGQLENYTVANMISEELINTLKWVIPGLLLYDGCRSRIRLQWAVGAVAAMVMLLTVQTIRYAPLRAAIDDDALLASRNIIEKNVGYHTCDLSPFLAGAGWAVMALWPVASSRWQKLALILSLLLTTYAQAVTGGRAGYVAWGATALVCCLIRWRKALPLLALSPLLAAMLFPAATNRMLHGFFDRDVAGQGTINDYEVTSGRTLAWPYVLEKIDQAPLLGHGRLAMRRTGVTARLMREWDEPFPHPHNMYLELVLDNGLLGALPVLTFFVYVIWLSVRMFRDRSHPWRAAVGGMVLAMLTAQAVAGMGSQTFYPRESTVVLFCTLCLVLRVHRESSRAAVAAAGRPVVARAAQSGGITVHDHATAQ